MAEAAQGNNGGVDLEKELSCSICTDVLFQPLTLLDCLHTFCGSCLKEWFKWQADAASQSRRTTQPYTCPSCRAEVRGTRPNATVTTLLDMFLRANPSRGKTVVEMDEMRQLYKPGDDVIPPVRLQQGSDDSEDERLMDEVRELSMADIDPAVAANRRAQRNDRRRRQEQASAIRPEELGASNRASAWAGNRARGAEGRHVEHQPSLRGLLSASEPDSQEVQAEIMQSIMSSGILDGIDIDNLTPAQEEALTNRIAEEYRRRRRRRERSATRDRRTATESSSRPASSGADAGTRPRTRGDSAASQAPPRSRPPISRPHLFEQGLQEPPRHHRRTGSAASGTSQRSHQSARHSDGPTPASTPAARSATDLSSTPSSEEPQRDQRRRPSGSSRSVTDPEGARPMIHAQRARAASGAQRTTTDAPRPASHALENVRRQDGVNNSSPSLITPYPLDSPIEQTIRPVPSAAAFAPEAAPTQQQDAVPVPSITCNRCSNPNIQHDLHYHCSTCENGAFNLCLSCYRAGRGCNHWFGFGYVAWTRWRRAISPDNTTFERPHILLARRYRRPTESQTTPDPAQSLQAGACCERCFQFTNSCYYHCYICFEGAWGYCGSCVNKGHHCTHALLPVEYVSAGSEAAAKATFISLPHLPDNTYAVHAVQQDCDICHYPIPPSSTRFHCNECNDGDYDICTECYRSLVAQGKISNGNGPNGWRRCLRGHRMAVIGFQDNANVGKQRLVVREPVGGRALKEDDAGPQQLATHQQLQQLPPDGGVGLRCLALWSRFVEDGVEDELSFPKNAEVREAERMNEDWFWGVYQGDKGLFPGNHVRVLQ